MYKAIQWNNFKIDINNPNFMIEELLGKSYDFNDYSKWNKLTKIITKI